jgi:hypothetical protein
MPAALQWLKKILPGKRSHSGFSLASPDAVNYYPIG